MPASKPKTTMVHERPDPRRHLSERVKNIATSATLATTQAAQKLQKEINDGIRTGFGRL